MEQKTKAIDPGDLLIYARVADLGSFSKAAQELGLPKSTISRRITALEHALGERLLLRTTRRQNLTEFGSLLLEHARQVVAEVEAVGMLRELRRAQPSGRLRVSMPGDVGHLMLAEAIADFLLRYPEITLELDLSARRVDLLSEGFDVAVRIGELASDSLLAARRLAVLSGSLYASNDYIRTHGEPLTPQDLSKHQALHLRGRNGEPVPWVLTQGATRWEGVPPGRVMANSPEMQIRLARLGVGIAAVDDRIAAHDVQRGNLRRLMTDWCLMGQPASAVFPGRKLMPAKTRVFIDMLQAAFSAQAR